MQLSKLSKKGQVTLDSVIGLTVTLLVIGFLIGIGLIMNERFLVAAEDPTSGDSDVANDTIGQISDAFGDIAGWMPLIALAVIAVIIIGLMMIFRGAGRRGA